MNEGSPTAQEPGRNPGLDSLMSTPLVGAMTTRRTHRIARGTSVRSGPLTYESKNKPEPLTALEEAVLICSMGMTGLVTHDGPLVRPDGGDELGTPFMNIVGRAAASPDNCQTTHFFMINDDGIWLLRQPRGEKALETLKDLPPNWSDWKEGEWIHAAESVKVRISNRRLEFPREFPYYFGWNKQISNVPGTTLFLPIVDLTHQYINVLLNAMTEPDGQRPFALDDWQRFRPRSVIEFLAKVGSATGLSPEIPYQPIGGLKWIRNGFCNKNNAMPLGMMGTLKADLGAMLHLQNLTLVAESMGLGTWTHLSVFPPFLFQVDPAKGWHGLGFRMDLPKKLHPMPPAPASQPNPVGIDGLLEGNCPPYVKSMDDAVDQVLEDKFGSQGAYGDFNIFKRPYRSEADAAEYLKIEKNYSKDAVQYVKDICNYLYDTYGRFPAHVDAFYTQGIWLQCSHVEMEYYEKFFDPAIYPRQSAHDALWHR